MYYRKRRNPKGTLVRTCHFLTPVFQEIMLQWWSRSGSGYSTDLAENKERRFAEMNSQRGVIRVMRGKILRVSIEIDRNVAVRLFLVLEQPRAEQHFRPALTGRHMVLTHSLHTFILIGFLKS